MAINVKPVTDKNELDQVMSIRDEVFVKEQKVPSSLETDKWEGSATHFLALASGLPAGCARFRWLPGGVGKVERVAVLSSQRGSGMGRTLMEAVESYAREHGATMIQLHAQTQAVPFYRKLGYQATGEPFMDAGIEHLAMKKPIHP